MSGLQSLPQSFIPNTRSGAFSPGRCLHACSRSQPPTCHSPVTHLTTTSLENGRVQPKYWVPRIFGSLRRGVMDMVRSHTCHSALTLPGNLILVPFSPPGPQIINHVQHSILRKSKSSLWLVPQQSPAAESYNPIQGWMIFLEKSIHFEVLGEK